MKKRILITSTDVMFWLFLRSHAKYLLGRGFQVTVACTAAESFASERYIEKIQEDLPDARIVQITGSRSPLSLKNISSTRQLYRLIKDGKFDVVWCNEPVVGALTRLASAMSNRVTRVVYLAHGLHFFVGGPLFNWILFPIEWFLSLITWRVVLINKTDLRLVERIFPCRSGYIPGIGFPVEKFRDSEVDRASVRQRLGISGSDFVLLAVGELNKNKNHMVILKAMAAAQNCAIKLLVCGVGGELERLRRFSEKSDLNRRVQFLGLRNDVKELMKCSDVFVHPSRREGLGIAPLEAMASGLPVIISSRHGMKDYSIDGVTGFVLRDPENWLELAKLLDFCANNIAAVKEMGVQNAKRVDKYSIDNVHVEIYKIIAEACST